MSATLTDSPFICAVDNTSHDSLEALHRHIRYVLKLTQEQYYTKHAPRRDLWTGEVIPFKAPAERYLQTEFAHKNHLKEYVRKHPDGKAWAINWLRKRKHDKKLTYPPTQVELRSLFAPSRHHYETIGGYNALCETVGYTVLHNDVLPSDQLTIRDTIIVDTREQDPLALKHPHLKGTLRCGDYGLAGAADKGVYIERKSLNDFVGTLSDRATKGGTDSSFARFTRELERAEETGSYIVLLCEANINDALGFNHLPQFTCRGPLVWDPKTRKRKREYRGVLPEHIFHNLRELLHRFPTVFQALFVNDRDEAAAAVPRLLAMGRRIERIDLHWEYERGALTLKPQP